MKNNVTRFIFGIILLISLQTNAQTNDYKLENQFMNCVCSMFDDNGTELKKRIKNAEKELVKNEVLANTRGESYIALFKNIRTAIDGRVATFGISDYVIQSLMSSSNAKKYNACMGKMMQDAAYKDSKINKFITLSTTSGSNPKITDLTSKMLEIFEAKDFNHDFYKYLTFSLIDKYNMANKK
ncbi:hypothetical protein C8N46_11271 [Kordia periserrulae]|uniref:DUF4476 domain-containing protein n=1 Tax=Kordia periserrulae TaxID=701523 RepID=A0A2T6BRP7_9FLAO|nr:hypothetical protein [Kordia periserrulae]PTX58763.1 hypothetical protein C8N46_11271 [Kordia periserrulae]